MNQITEIPAEASAKNIRGIRLDGTNLTNTGDPQAILFRGQSLASKLIPIILSTHNSLPHSNIGPYGHRISNGSLKTLRHFLG